MRKESTRVILAVKFEFMPQNCHQLPEDMLLPRRAARAVDWIECILLQIDRIQEFALQVDYEVADWRAFLADDFHHLIDFAALTQNRTRFLDRMLVYRAGVLAPGIQWRNRRITPRIRTVTRQCQEGPHDFQRRLRHRLLEVTAGRRNCAANRNRSVLAIFELD